MTDYVVTEAMLASGLARAALAIGDHLVVRLAENPSTGYSWHVDQSGILTLVGSDYLPQAIPQRGWVGSGGEHSFRFHAQTAGASELRLSYSRPWEHDQAPAQTAVIAVEAR
ncbi:Protease inhibitor I42 family protein [Rhodovastum atsumiense]|uniref:Protease inhibitor I42 family protein n=1 Tax=Rhodovastum atsumiense TaxID=504468 RepID=A0A5M6J1C0_9PROT|nr:protease inhibitor I42 family protein [Rhodovastum atsumiense]KAA5613867.1 protease inhibitor I42 family protein [Rhodovastum atsumiense]CAH2601989.1 Protease inhibitor I42 family protein [Rhodovastum atsumiense]